MFTYAVNISIVFPGRPLAERLAQVAAAGFRAFEFWFPHEFDMDELARRARDLGLTVALFDLDIDPAHPHGYLTSPDTEDLFFQRLEEALRLAERLGCRRLNVMAGQRHPELSWEDQFAIAVDRLRRAAPRAENAGVTLLVEALNTFDRPLAFFHRSAQGFALVEAVNSPAVRFQYDLYHMQLMEGNLINTITQHLPLIRHLQVADVPGRHEPGTGEINVPNVLRAVAEAGYSDYVSLEYLPTDPARPFDWLPPAARAAG